ncbi:MAG: CehA/McbA family metallohydrolase [Myxococcota bacterium]
MPPVGPLTVEVEAYGQPAVATAPADAAGDVDLGDLAIPGVGALDLSVTLDGAPDHALVLVYPSGDDVPPGSLFGTGQQCPVLLGHPWGGSPACNRVLVDGTETVRLPPGSWDVYATAGPFATVAAATGVVVQSGTAQTVPLDLVTVPVQPAGTLSADFHVHGRASFDSAIPDTTRVQAFLAAHVDVIASTDHDVVNDYARALADAEVDEERLRLIVGLETTGHVLFPLVEGELYPKVIGHFNFWPVPYDPDGPWRGAPWDELAEPGTLFDRVADAGWPETGVVQLNHPWGGLQFGRDFAWPTAIGLDLTEPLPRTYDGTGQGLFLRTPPGATRSNADYQAQEVMNGSDNGAFEQYRAVWHYLLSQGVVRAGTANSDSHSLTDNVLGTPRNLVFTDATLADWDEVPFDAAVRDGRMVGTNGPVVLVDVFDADGAVRTPSVHAFAPDEGASLHIVVQAAPWVPVDEVRILVNGRVVRRITEELVDPADPLGADGLLRLDGQVRLSELLPEGGDAWIVVEAGAPLVEQADLDCDGVPDTGDNDGDGAIDWRDVADLDADPGTACLDTVGPLGKAPPPARGDPGYLFTHVVPGGTASAFTNPLLLDRDGDGRFTGVAP